MINPRYVDIPPDETMWFYDYDPSTPSSPTPFEDPKGFFDREVFGDARCNLPQKQYQFVYARLGSRGSKIQFSGVCGTRLIIVSGIGEQLFMQFHKWRLMNSFSRLVDLDEWNRFVDATDSMQSHAKRDEMSSRRVSASSFWDNFEDALAGQPHREGDIEFYFFPSEEQVYIHLELGSDVSFSGDYFANLSDRAGFKNWLLTGTRIARRAFEVDPAGSKIPLNNLSISEIDFDESSFETMTLTGSPTCPSGCEFRACSILAGSIETYDPNAGATFGLEVVGVKSYCVDSLTQGPCIGP